MKFKLDNNELKREFIMLKQEEYVLKERIKSIETRLDNANI